MKLLLYIPEFPFAHHGGAARSMRTIGEFMAGKGHQVHCVCTLATERPCNVAEALQISDKGKPPEYRGVKYRLVNTSGSIQTWRTDDAEDAVNTFWDNELASFGPDIVLAYGGHPTDERRYDGAKRSGAKLAFRLSNFGYTIKPSFFNRMDAVMTCSRFLSDWYKERIGIESTPLPLPIQAEDVVAEKHEPHYFTFINPARRKGVVLMAAVFQALQQKRPDIPLMAVGDSDEPDKAKALSTLEMPWKTRPVLLPWQSNPKEIYRHTKVLLVPSVWQEPAGRVVVEAMLNGIPPIVSDRGGLVETMNMGGYGGLVIPINKAMTPQSTAAFPEDVEAWTSAIVHLQDDRAALARASLQASLGGNLARGGYIPAVYEDFFLNMLTSNSAKTAGCGALKTEASC